MRILLISHRYPPDIGGIEVLSELLANHFVSHGHDVVVVTYGGGHGRSVETGGAVVVRNPTPLELLRETVRANVIFHNNITLKFLWPLVLIRRPWVVATHTWISRNDRSLGLRDLIKRFVLKFAVNISISRAIANDINLPSVVVPNGYNDNLFRRLDYVKRESNSLVFVGRLVRDKGVSQLLDAVTWLHHRGLRVSLTIVGEGQERGELERYTRGLGISDYVTFEGALFGSNLVEVLNRHDVIVVPSVWDEPFGLVALEGMACGCVVVASQNGGLGEAVGDAGVLFPNGDTEGLVGALESVLLHSELKEELRAKSEIHLLNHTLDRMADAYLRILGASIPERRLLP